MLNEIIISIMPNDAELITEKNIHYYQESAEAIALLNLQDIWSLGISKIGVEVDYKVITYMGVKSSDPTGFNNISGRGNLPKYLPYDFLKNRKEGERSIIEIDSSSYHFIFQQKGTRYERFGTYEQALLFRTRKALEELESITEEQAKINEINMFFNMMKILYATGHSMRDMPLNCHGHVLTGVIEKAIQRQLYIDKITKFATDKGIYIPFETFKKQAADEMQQWVGERKNDHERALADSDDE